MDNAFNVLKISTYRLGDALASYALNLTTQASLCPSVHLVLRIITLFLSTVFQISAKKKDLIP